MTTQLSSSIIFFFFCFFLFFFKERPAAKRAISYGAAFARLTLLAALQMIIILPYIFPCSHNTFQTFFFFFFYQLMTPVKKMSVTAFFLNPTNPVFYYGICHPIIN